MQLLNEDPSFQHARHRMVEDQLRARGIRDEQVLSAMERVPRQEFVDKQYWPEAYSDYPIPLPNGQSVSQPYMVALMLEALRVHRDGQVLEIGTGTGYQAALLAEMADRVVSIERVDPLAAEARENLMRLGIENVEVITGDGSKGYPPRAPYHRIIVAAAAPSVPLALVEQLADGGVLLVPVGSSDMQVVHRVTRDGTQMRTERLETCRFVPLIGEQGYRNEF
jgi:protein-L-isoaspartate(D-aspartate) O-methyltransferase